MASTAPVTTFSSTAPDAHTLRQYFQLDPNITFLNHGSFGATPKPVFEVYQAWQRQIEQEPVAFIGRRQDTLLDAARGQIAPWLNTDASNFVFVDNATTGINIIARSISLKPGDEILTTNLEYGALDFTWDYLCQKAGATYIHQDIPLPATTREAIVDALWDGVTERTRAIFMSHITSGTAMILPVQEICARARERGILTIIDGAHVPGQLDIDLAALDCDIYSGNFHKWLCTPKGTAFLYVRPEQQHWVESLPISWGWRPEHTFVTRNQKQGTRDVSGYLSVTRGIEFQREHNWPAVRERCHQMLKALRQELHERWGTTPLYPDSPEWYRQLAVITLPDDAPEDLQERLFMKHAIEVPLTGHGDFRGVRVSVQGYTTDDDLDRLREALSIELGR